CGGRRFEDSIASAANQMQRHGCQAIRFGPRRKGAADGSGFWERPLGEGVGPVLKGVCRGYGARGPCSGDELMIRHVFIVMQGNRISYPELSTGIFCQAAVWKRPA